MISVLRSSVLSGLRPLDSPSQVGRSNVVAAACKAVSLLEEIEAITQKAPRT